MATELERAQALLAEFPHDAKAAGLASAPAKN